MAEYYTDWNAGDDGNAGTSEGAGNAFKTISHAVSSMTAGDICWIKNNGDYNEMVELTFTYAGSSSAPNLYSGYDSVTGDSGQATMDGTGLGSVPAAGGGLYGASARYSIFRNLRVCNYDGHGIKMNANQNYHTYHNIYTSGNNGVGIYPDNNSQSTFVNCRATQNYNDTYSLLGAIGYSTTENALYVNCIVWENNTTGFHQCNDGHYYNCVAFANSGSPQTFSLNDYTGFYSNGTSPMINCTSVGNTITNNSGCTGIDFGNCSNTQEVVAINCLVENCTTGMSGYLASLSTQGTALGNIILNNQIGGCDVEVAAQFFGEHNPEAYTIYQLTRSRGINTTGTSKPYDGDGEVGDLDRPNVRPESGSGAINPGDPLSKISNIPWNPSTDGSGLDHGAYQSSGSTVTRRIFCQ